MIAILYIPIAVLLGWYNAHLVNTWVDWSKGRKIKHFWSGVVHCTFAAIVWIFADFKTVNIPDSGKNLPRNKTVKFGSFLIEES